MRFLVVTGKNTIEYQNTAKPEPRPVDALVRVAYTGICGTDLEIIRGEGEMSRKGLFRYPCRIGHEWSGVIEAVGSAVTDFGPGDRVVCDSGVSCGECEFCLAGEHHKCRRQRAIGTLYPEWPGAFAEYMCVPTWHLHKIPDNVGLEEAAVVEPASIAQRGINYNLKGKTVLVTGTGPIGLAGVGLAKCYGSGCVIMGGRREKKLAIARQAGADHCLNMSSPDFVDEVMKITNGHGVDLLLEASGSMECIKSTLPLMAKYGCMRLQGFYDDEMDGFAAGSLVYKHRTIYGGSADGRGGVHPVDQDEILRFMSEGKLDLRPLITHEFSFDEAAQAMVNADRYNSTKIKMLVKISG